MKALHLFAVLCIANFSYGQIASFTFQAVKDYDNNTRIAYFSLDGFKDADELNFVKKEFLKNPGIIRFETYSKDENSNQWMIESTPDYDEAKIISSINHIIRKSDELKEKFADDIIYYYKEIYEIPDDCPVFDYYPVTEEKSSEFLEKMDEWKIDNPEKYNEIKHLRDKVIIADQK